jgi:hypothetical protein
LATHQPVLFIVEDLHWIDPSTLDFLTTTQAFGLAIQAIRMIRGSRKNPKSG